MKTIVFIIWTGLTALGCAYNCPNNNKAHCGDHVPGGPCNEEHTRWFYRPASNDCIKVTFIGCDGYGFGSEDKCMECRCGY